MSRAEQHAPLPDDVARRWMKFGRDGTELFVNLVGLVVEEVRTDYCRMRMPFRDSLNQAAGIVHGGAIASLLDSVVVPVVGSAYGREARYSTVDMHVQFMSALVGEDAVAEGWVVKRGRSLVFCESEVVAAVSGKTVARSVLTYHVSA
ncbi:MAG: PaaI family thioesterase [Actinobacteria bacterium]|nr:PaaI family thioesterase [Actinomycetota bacterium]